MPSQVFEFLSAALLLVIGLSVPLLAIVRAWVVDRTLDTAPAFLCTGLVMLYGATAWHFRGTIMLFVMVGILIGGCLILPVLGSHADRMAFKEMDDEDIAKYQRALMLDPNNASACGFLGDAYMRRKQYSMAIPAYEKAIHLRPNTDQAKRWQRQLKEAHELQVDAGPRHSELNFEVCHVCGHDVPQKAAACPHCNATLKMGFVKWLSQPEVIKDISRITLIAMLILTVLVAILSALPLEAKACVMMAAVIVGGWYFLRGIGPNAPLE